MRISKQVSTFSASIRLDLVHSRNSSIWTLQAYLEISSVKHCHLYTLGHRTLLCWRSSSLIKHKLWERWIQSGEGERGCPSRLTGNQQSDRCCSQIVFTSNPSIWEDEAGSLLVSVQPGLYIKFEASMSYIVRPRLKKLKQNKTKQNRLNLGKTY